MYLSVIFIGLAALNGYATGRAFVNQEMGAPPLRRPYTREDLIRGVQGITVVDVGDPRDQILYDGSAFYGCPKNTSIKGWECQKLIKAPDEGTYRFTDDPPKSDNKPTEDGTPNQRFGFINQGLNLDNVMHSMFNGASIFNDPDVSVLEGMEPPASFVSSMVSSRNGPIVMQQASQGTNVQSQSVNDGTVEQHEEGSQRIGIPDSNLQQGAQGVGNLQSQTFDKDVTSSDPALRFGNQFGGGRPNSNNPFRMQQASRGPGNFQNQVYNPGYYDDPSERFGFPFFGLGNSGTKLQQAAQGVGNVQSQTISRGPVANDEEDQRFGFPNFGHSSSKAQQAAHGVGNVQSQMINTAVIGSGIQLNDEADSANRIHSVSSNINVGNNIRNTNEPVYMQQFGQANGGRGGGGNLMNQGYNNVSPFMDEDPSKRFGETAFPTRLVNLGNTDVNDVEVTNVIASSFNKESDDKTNIVDSFKSPQI